jgi:copper transport protein
MRRVLVTVLVGLLASTIASTHAELLRSEPAQGSVLSAPPRQVQLSFSEPVETVPDAIVVKAADGTRIDRGEAAVSPGDRSSMAVNVELRTRGTYTVVWRAISADGHPINGSFLFSFGEADGAARAPAAQEGSGLAGYLQPLGRSLHLLAIVMLTGGMVMLLVLGADLEPVLAGRLWGLARAGMVLGVVAAGVMLVAQTAAVNGSLRAALHPGAVWGVLRSHWGALWAVRTMLTVALGGVVTWATGTVRMTLAAAGLAALLLATAMNGHSAATAPIALSLAIDWVHLAATGAWVGGLLALSVCVLPWINTITLERRRTLVMRAIPRFSTVSLIAVELLIVTGLYHAWAHLTGPEALVSTAYGRTLLVKGGLIALTLLPAALNLLVIRPRVAVLSERRTDEPGLLQRLRRLITSETALAIAILVVAALLTTLPDSRAVAAEARAGTPTPAAVESLPQATFVANAGAAFVRIGFSPGQVGSNRVTFSVQDAGGTPVRPAAPRLRIEPPSGSGIPPWTVTPARDATTYAATLDLAPAGMWTVSVLGVAESDAVFAVRIPFRGAGELLALADAARNRLRSVVEDATETTPSGVVQVRTEYAAPDRMHRRSDTGEETMIGSTRYLHHGTMWHEEQGEAFHWPASALSASARDILLLGTDQVNGQECLVVQFIDGTTGIHHQVWIAVDGWRLLQATEVAPGRTVSTRYSAFDRPITIAPPRK